MTHYGTIAQKEGIKEERMRSLIGLIGLLD
jgi:hypothetical protein